MSTIFTSADSWNGGFYEISIEMKDKDDSALDKAIRICWSYSGVKGCYTSKTMEPSDQVISIPSLNSLNENGHLLGTIKLQNGNLVPCGMTLIREENGPDFIDMYLPLGGLVAAFPDIGGYPFGNNEYSRKWREPIDDLLTDVGIQVYNAVPYSLGSIGFEVSGDIYSNEIPRILSQKRYNRYLVPQNGKLMICHPTVWA